MYMKYIGENILLWKVFLLMNLHVEAKLCGSNPYYIDRYDLWGFIREINSGISYKRNHFFPTRTTSTQLYMCYRLRLLLCYGEYTHDCKVKQLK